MKTIKIYSSVGVNVGNVRENNEDNFYYNGLYLNKDTREIPAVYSEEKMEQLQIYAVCDGMGGEAMGEEASLTAVEMLNKHHQNLKYVEECDFDKYIEMYLIEASNAIYEKCSVAGSGRMGTTIAMVCLHEGKIHVYNVGDSRVYRMHGNKLVQVSEDHTQVMREIRMGIIDKKEAKTHPHRNRLTQFMGVSSEELIIQPNIAKFDAVNNDIYLICSDGVTDMIEDEELKEILRSKKSEQEMVCEIIDKAKNNGGRDNITAIVLRIDAKRKWFGK